MRVGSESADTICRLSHAQSPTSSGAKEKKKKKKKKTTSRRPSVLFCSLLQDVERGRRRCLQVTGAAASHSLLMQLHARRLFGTIIHRDMDVAFAFTSSKHKLSPQPLIVPNHPHISSSHLAYPLENNPGSFFSFCAVNNAQIQSMKVSEYTLTAHLIYKATVLKVGGVRGGACCECMAASVECAQVSLLCCCNSNKKKAICPL